MTAQHEIVRLSFDVFADAMARLVSGLAVVTAPGLDGRPSGLLVSSICSYSAEPPSLLVSIGHARSSYPALVASARFGVHLLRAGHEGIAETFSKQQRDRFADVAWRWDEGVPRLEDVPVFAVCVRSAVLHHGDHAVIIGEVTRVETAPGDPLVYYQRRLGWRLR